MTLRFVLTALLALALLLQGGLRPFAADAAAAPEWSEVTPTPGSTWAVAELPAGLEALSEQAGSLPACSRFCAELRAMEAPAAATPRRPAEAPRHGIERPPRA